MIPTPAEQQDQLFQLLNGMPSAEHGSFLGHWLYPLIEVHDTYITLGYLYCLFIYTPSTGMSCPPLAYMV
jgi:hypothetical protein